VPVGDRRLHDRPVRGGLIRSAASAPAMSTAIATDPRARPGAPARQHVAHRPPDLGQRLGARNANASSPNVVDAQRGVRGARHRQAS
jgi:hypothetical protein